MRFQKFPVRWAMSALVCGPFTPPRFRQSVRSGAVGVYPMIDRLLKPERGSPWEQQPIRTAARLGKQPWRVDERFDRHNEGDWLYRCVHYLLSKSDSNLFYVAVSEWIRFR